MGEVAIVFGHNELAEVLTKQRKTHLPTLQSVLDVLGIPNVAEQEALAAAGRAEKAATAADNEADKIVTEDKGDEERTAEAVANLMAARRNRAMRAKFAADQQRFLAITERIKNKRLEGLAKTAKKMTS